MSLPQTSSPPALPSDLEAAQQLADLARGKLGNLPSDLVIGQVLRLYPSDWNLQRAALDAILRRLAFARRDELRVTGRPAERRVQGDFRTGPPRGKRPYTTRLEGIEPLQASCDCPDFRRNSLGLCKHVLVVLDDLASKPRSWARLTAPTGIPHGPRLLWDSTRPLRGPGDWLERVRLIPGASSRVSAAWRAVRRSFVQGADGTLLPRVPAPEDYRGRGRLVRALQRFLAARARSGQPGDPALVARLRDEQEELNRRQELREARPQLTRALEGLDRSLFPYQSEGVARFLARGRLLLADDMGLGKTTQAAAAGQALFRAGLVHRGLLIVPAPLKSQWASEWAALGNVPAEIVDGSPGERAATYRRTKRGFLIANYEQVLRDVELMRSWQPDLVVLDEAQRIKNWATRTAHLVKTLESPYRLVLTGTPMENRLDEVASILDWVDDHALEPKWRLAPWHTRAAEEGEPAGARNLDTLRERLAPVLLRRRRTEVLNQLPPRRETTLQVALTQPQREAHDDLIQPISRLMHAAERRPLTQAEFLRLMSLLTTQRVIANGLAQLDFTDVWPGIEGRRPTERRLHRLDAPKLIELREIVHALCIEQERTIVIFSQWRRMLQLAHWAVSDLLESEGLRAVFFTGRESQKRRTANLVDLHDDPATRVLFASDAGGVGLNLQHAASACIHLELPWNPAVLEQRNGRIWRLGQTEPVEIYHLVSRDCIEARIAAIVSDKRELFSGLFDGDSDSVDFTGSASFLEGVRSALDLDAPGPAPDEDPPSSEDSEGEDEVLAAADETADHDTARPAGHAIATGHADLTRLFAGLRIEPTEQGGLRIEAEPEAAETLATLFEGLAASLRASRGD